MRGLIIGAVVVAASSTAALAQDIEAGQISFKKCQPCHDVGEAAKNKIGPTLNGLDGRKSGSVEGNSYSDANKNSGITWSETTSKNTSTIHAPRFPTPR
jgi:cytochrome c